MESKTKSDRKIRERYKKRADFNLSKISQNLNLTVEKEKKYKKNKEEKRENEKSEEKKTEEKKEKEKLDSEIELVKKELLINKKSQINNYKSINYFLSDSETTVGDTLNDYSKKKICI